MKTTMKKDSKLLIEYQALCQENHSLKEIIINLESIIKAEDECIKAQKLCINELQLSIGELQLSIDSLQGYSTKSQMALKIVK
jgi:hypothetical protein